MKRVLLWLLISMPCLSYAQTMADTTTIFFPEKQPDRIYIMGGNIISTDSINAMKLKVKDIEDVRILKETSGKQITSCQPTKAFVVITLKDRVEHSIHIMANGYDSFLATQPPKDFFSEASLKNKNQRLVNEWNSLCRNPSQLKSAEYAIPIDYNAKEEYGLDIEYQLYMFFC